MVSQLGAGPAVTRAAAKLGSMAAVEDMTCAGDGWVASPAVGMAGGKGSACSKVATAAGELRELDVLPS